MFKLGLDYHGVVTDNPDFFNMLSNIIIKSGGEVHIMTGSRKSDFLIEESYNNTNIQYTHFYSISDNLIELGFKCDLSRPHNPVFEDKLAWDLAKSKYAKENGIDLVIDDSARYGEYFETPFVLWKTDRNSDLFKESIIGELVKRTR